MHVILGILILVELYAFFKSEKKLASADYDHFDYFDMSTWYYDDIGKEALASVSNSGFLFASLFTCIIDLIPLFSIPFWGGLGFIPVIFFIFNLINTANETSSFIFNKNFLTGIMIRDYGKRFGLVYQFINITVEIISLSLIMCNY